MGGAHLPWDEAGPRTCAAGHPGRDRAPEGTQGIVLRVQAHNYRHAGMTYTFQEVQY